MNFLAAAVAATLMSLPGFSRGQEGASITYTASTFAGDLTGGFSPDGTTASDAVFTGISDVTVDGDGNVYLVDSGNLRVRKIDSDGVVSTVAGGGFFPFSSGPVDAGAVFLIGPNDVAVDADGNVLLTANSQVFKVTPGGQLDNFAGDANLAGFFGDDGPATDALLQLARGLAVLPDGSVLILDALNNRIRKVTPDGIIRTMAGTGTAGSGGDGGPATDAELSPGSGGLAVDAEGNVYVAEELNNRVRMIDTNGTITTFAGGGSSLVSVNNVPATEATLDKPRGVAVGPDGSVFIADVNTVRRVDPDGIIWTIMGPGTGDLFDDSGPATERQIVEPHGITVDGQGIVYVAETQSNRIRKLTPSELFQADSGTGDDGSTSTTTDSLFALAIGTPRDLSLATMDASNVHVFSVETDGEFEIVVDSELDILFRVYSGVAATDLTDENLIETVDGLFSGRETLVKELQAGSYLVVVESFLMAESGPYTISVTGPPVSAGPAVTVVGGGNDWGFSGDGGPAGEAQLTETQSLFGDESGNLYLTDRWNKRVRQIDPDGIIRTVIGNGSGGAGATLVIDQPDPVDATIDIPDNVFVLPGGIVYFSAQDRIIRRAADGRMSFVAGAGFANSGGDVSGDGGPATDALIGISGFFVTADEEIYIADRYANRIRKVSKDGVITTVAGGGPLGWRNGTLAGDGGPAADASFNHPNGVFLDREGNLYVPDGQNHRIRRIDAATGVITTIAGSGSTDSGGFNGDGGPATEATLDDPSELFVDDDGNVFFSSSTNNRVRKIDTVGNISTVVGPETVVRPAGIFVDSSGNLFVGDTGNSRILRFDGAAAPTSLPLGPEAPADSVPDDPGPTPGPPSAPFVGVPTLESIATGEITTILGGYLAEGESALLTDLRPAGVFADDGGHVWVTDVSRGLVRKIDATGNITTVAGSGEPGFSGDGGPALEAELRPDRVYPDADGNLYVAEARNQRIRKIDTSGIITTVAGSGETGLFNGAFEGDGGPATDARLNLPFDVLLDDDGSFLIADAANVRIRSVDPGGTITTIAGSGGIGSEGDGGPALDAQMNLPSGLARDAAGNLYVADAQNERIRMIDPGGQISTVAGTGEDGLGGDGGPGTDARLDEPASLTVDPSGNLLIADSRNDRVRKLDTEGTITTFAGSDRGFAGDGGPATLGKLDNPVDVSVGPDGSVYIADNGNRRVRKVDPDGIITTIAGTGSTSFGDGGPAMRAGASSIGGVFVDSEGAVVFSDAGGYRIRRIDTFGTIHTFAGTGENRTTGDGGPALEAGVSFPSDVLMDGAGQLFVVSPFDNRIRMVDAAGEIRTIAGTGESEWSGDGGAATEAELWNPESLALDGQGNLFVADARNHRVRRIDPDGVITTYAGSGDVGFSGGGYFGDGGPATDALMQYPIDVAIDAGGNLYVAERDNHVVRRVDANGTITTFAGTGSPGYGGDGGPATEAQFDEPVGVVVDGDGNVFILDRKNYRVRRVDADGVVTTVAGSGLESHGGDGGAATSAGFRFTRDIFIDRDGNLYVADDDRIRVVRGIAAPTDPPAAAALTAVSTGAPADFDGDGSVGFADFLSFATAFGLSSGDAGFDSKFDLDGDGSIGFTDFLQFANAFGT